MLTVGIGLVDVGKSRLNFCMEMGSTMFYKRGGGEGYYETGMLPEIDFMKDSLFLILDTEAYFQQQEENSGGSARKA